MGKDDLEPVLIEGLTQVYMLSLPQRQAEKEALCALEQTMTKYGIGKGSIVFAVSKEKENICVYCYSGKKKNRALELLDDVIGSYGIVKGDAQMAQGRLSEILLRTIMEDENISEISQYFTKRVIECFGNVDEIYAREYGKKNKELIAALPVYLKKKVMWCVVRTMDIAPKGTRIRVRTLENDSGVMIEADPNRYIMIGHMGEVYDIEQKKYEQTYEETDEVLDIFAAQMDYIPVIEVEGQGEVVIDELARVCYPRQGAGIYAKELARKTKIFMNEDEEYYVGQAGDFMAIRLDDPTDIYIIQRDIFHKTYARKQEEEAWGK